MYDVTDLDSFEKVKTWYFELRKYIPKEAPIIIAGNKCDIVNRTVELEDAERYAKEIGIEHVSASALSGHNVNYIFNTLPLILLPCPLTLGSLLRYIFSRHCQVGHKAAMK